MRKAALPLAAIVVIMPTATALAEPSLRVEAMTDDRRRGISWSGGSAALVAGVGVPIGPHLRLSADAATARGSARHGGADIALDFSVSYYRSFGLLRLDAVMTSHHFPGGAGALDYIEVGGGAAFLIGPADLELFASYVPHQTATGGDNLYLGGRARVALIGTPVTLVVGLGRSGGDADNAARAARLRPGGSYTDWQIGAEYVAGSLAFGIDYVGTDLSRMPAASSFADGANVSDRVLARASFRF